MKDSGLVFDLARCSLHDGPGIRSVVFLKGCPLRCVWCHNPESRSFRPEILFSQEKCIGCGECVKVCPNHARGSEDGRSFFRRELCAGCGRCAEVCFSGAMELSGQVRTVDSILTEAAMDQDYYAPDGGLTISGGEPLSQPDFTEALLKGAKERGWTTALETCGMVDPVILERMMPWTDFWLFDIKAVNGRIHRLFTGQPNDLILSNLRFLDHTGANIELRCPLIPGYNDSDSDLRALRDLALSLKRKPKIHMEPFHPFGRSKLARLGRSAEENARIPEEEDISRWRRILF